MKVQGTRMMHPFLSAWLRNPKQMGAIAPSGVPLARSMAAQVPAGARTVLELGPGTGCITHALLKRRGDLPRLLVVEKEPTMAAALVRCFPDVEVLTGDAAHLRRLLVGTGVEQVDVVVSSLPLLSMRPFGAMKILLQIFSVLSPSGRLVQYSYSPVSPISARMVARLGLDVTRAAVVLRNLPPASVWVYRRPHLQIAREGRGRHRAGNSEVERETAAGRAARGLLQT